MFCPCSLVFVIIRRFSSIFASVRITYIVVSVLYKLKVCQLPPLREREMFYLTTHSTHFIYGYIASDIWLKTILIVRKETRCCHIGYSFRLAARVLLYAPSHRQDSTYHGLCQLPPLKSIFHYPLLK